MLKRLNIYFKEMYPFIPRLLLGFIVFGEIYFILLLNYGVTDFSLGIQEIVGGITVFGFLMFLRIADEAGRRSRPCRKEKTRPSKAGAVQRLASAA